MYLEEPLVAARIIIEDGMVETQWESITSPEPSLLVGLEDEKGTGRNEVLVECRADLVGKVPFDGDSVVGDSKRLGNRWY